MKRILVTGGAGFIGSNFIRHILDCQNNIEVLVNLDALTYAGNLENLSPIQEDHRYRFVKGNICNKEIVEQIFCEYDINTVVHFAAESHVDRSIETPELFSITNILGTQILLDTARHHWKIYPNNKYSMEYREGVKYLQVSTDEVYGALGSSGMFTEESPLSPNSPYSASKASADLIVRAYHKTYGMPVNITRCSNNYGPYQFPEKLIPLVICNAAHNKMLPVYGEGIQVRDWLHVSDHCAAIVAVLEKGISGEVYNISGGCEKANIEVVRFILNILGKPESLISYIKDRPGHDLRYSVDSTKITSELGWLPTYTFEQGMYETVQWYLENWGWVERIKSVGHRGIE